MKGNICRAFLFDRHVSAVCINSTDIVNHAIKTHSLSPVCAAAMGRTLSVTGLMAAGLKNADDSITVTIAGGGPCGQVVTACDGSLDTLRGYVQNPQADLPLRPDGKLNVGGAVGKDGTLTVVKDLGLKSPYVGKTELVSGEIAQDFAYYFAVSEQQPSIVSLGVLIGTDRKCRSAGGMVISLLPGCPQDIIERTEQLAGRFLDISTQFEGIDAEQFMLGALGDCQVEITGFNNAVYGCKCSKNSIDRVVLTLGKEDALALIAERGSIEVKCHFCNKQYRYMRQDIEMLFT